MWGANVDRLKDLPKPTYSIPVSNGLFAHREKIGSAIWVFLWLIDATTKEIPGADGKAEGLVYGGRPLPLGAIAADLKMSWRSTYEQLAQLVEGGYIRKIANGNGRANGYAVVNSKRFAKRGKSRDASAGTTVRSSTGTTEENRIGTPEEKCEDLCRRTSVPMQKSATLYKEEVLQDNTRQEDDRDDEPITEDMIARGVLQTLGPYGDELLTILIEVCRSELKRGDTADAIRDRLIAAGSDYSKARSDGRITQYSPGWKVFFGERSWKDRASWRLKDDSASSSGVPRERKYDTIQEKLAQLGAPQGVAS
jgi:hypothetical protein